MHAYLIVINQDIYEFGRVHVTELKDTIVHIPIFENQD